jgi:putative two-component system response regulator
MDIASDGERASDRPLILLIDDLPDNLAVMVEFLREAYELKLATSGEEGLALARSLPRPQLIVLDVMMPGLDGYETCRRLKADPLTQDIPVIFLTARGEERDEALGLSLGAVDYLNKPVSLAIMQARVRTHLRLQAVADFFREKSDFLEAEVQRRTEEVESLQDVVVLALASLGETRDNETGNHLLRTQHYVLELAEALADHPRFASALTPPQRRLLFKSAPLHDIGKVGIADAILLKPGRLTVDEFEVMKTHTTLGFEALVRAEKQLGRDVPLLNVAKEIALSHQEWWDGTGYPQGLAGDAIPVSARLMAVGDVYDALITVRPYKRPWTHADAVAHIRDGRGTHFDPDVVDAFLRLAPRFRAIAAQFADPDPGSAG